MIDLKNVYEIRNALNNKAIDKIQDNVGNIIYEAWKNLLASGILPLTLTRCKGDDLVDYKIYGKSVETGTPIEGVGDKTSNIADLSKAKASTTTPYTKFNYDNLTGTLELTSTPNAFDYTSISAENLGLEVGKTYYYGGDIIVSGKSTNKVTEVAFALGTDSGYTIKFNENGKKHVNETFQYTGQSSVNLRLFFNYGSAEPAHVKYENVYVSELKDEFEPCGHKVPIRVRGKNILSVEQMVQYQNELSQEIKFNTNSSIVNFEGENCMLAKPTDFYMNRYYYFPLNCKENTRYTLSYEACLVNTISPPEIDTQVSGLKLYYSDGTTSSGKIFNQLGWQKDTLISDANKTIVGIGIVYVYNPSIYFKNVQLEQGMEQTQYEQYIEPATINIYLDEPLKENEYISYKENNLPNIKTFKGTTVIEVDTEIHPSNMEVVYKGKNSQK